MLLGYAAGETVSAIRAVAGYEPAEGGPVRAQGARGGALAALEDLPRRGRSATISAWARAWLVASACRKATELGHAEELWTVRRLAAHARAHFRDAGHPDLSSVAPGTASKILASQVVRPHRRTWTSAHHPLRKLACVTAV